MNKADRNSANFALLLSLARRKPKFLARLGWGALMAIGARRKRLRFMDVAVDYACNMQCGHCSAVKLSDPREATLSLGEYESMAGQLRAEGCLIFHFTGGEPLLRPDLEGIIRAFKPDRCGISIQSNGLLAAGDRLRSLRDAGADIFCVSIDSGIPEEHDAFRNSPGSFHKALHAVDTALEIGYHVMISTCLSHANIDSPGFLKAVEIAESRGIWCSINLAVPAGKWRDCDEFMLTAEDQVRWREFVARHPLCHIDLQHNWLAIGCGAVKEKLYLTAYGDIMPCPFIQVSLGNLRREGIGEIRRRALRYPKFSSYNPTCLAAEDRNFIETTPCYHCEEEARLPMSWRDVEDMRRHMAPEGT